jgi:hypothetical protein
MLVVGENCTIIFMDAFGVVERRKGKRRVGLGGYNTCKWVGIIMGNIML